MQRPGNLGGINGPSWLGDFSDGRGRGRGHGRGHSFGKRTPEQRAARKAKRQARLAAMTAEQRAAWEQKRALKRQQRALHCGWWCRQKMRWFGPQPITTQNPVVLDMTPPGTQNPVVTEIQNATGVNPSQINGYFGGWGRF